MRAPTWTLAAVALLCAASAHAADDDEPTGPVFEGEVTVGWRFLDNGDKDEGRFPQDHRLSNGPRLFDLRLFGTNLSEQAWFDEAEFTAGGIGDRDEDYRLSLSRTDVLELDGGYTREDSTYRANGDPYPANQRREHGFFNARYTPNRNLTVRLEWDRRVRSGESFMVADTDLRTNSTPPPPGVDPDRVSQKRPLDSTFDVYTVGVDGAAGDWRYGLSQSIEVNSIDDHRLYDVPPARRTGGPIREDLRRKVRSNAYTTTGRLGTTLFDDAVDVTLFASYTDLPLDTNVSGRADGFDDSFSSGSERGQFEGTLDGGNDTTRTHTQVRGEVEWRVTEDVEVIASGEIDEVVDDASLNLTERRVYERTDVSPRTSRRDVDARITQRDDRWSIEVDADVSETVRLRVGEEYLRQDVTSPVTTHFASLLPTVSRSRTLRTMFGVDWKPESRTSLSLLARIGRNDQPQTTPVAEHSNEVVFRGRSRVRDDLTLTTVYRYKGFDNDDDFGSRTRSQSANVGATWVDGPWSVAGNATWQNLDTWSDTAFFELVGGSFTRLEDQVRYRTRDGILSLDVRRDLSPTVRVYATGTYVDSGGTYEADYQDLTVGAEWDVRDEITLGAAIRSFRLNEHDRSRDDYSVEALEITLTYRF
jgi:hypothetical protein